MSRHSAHTARARTVTSEGLLTELGEITVDFNLDESQSPYGDGSITAPIIENVAAMAACDPLTHRGLRVNLTLTESTGDPVVVSEITADFGGDVSTLTAAYGPAITPAKLTADYFNGWNEGDVRAGGSLRAALFVTNRTVDYAAQTMTFTVATDEAVAQAYKLVSTIAETSGSTSVRDTVNFALGKIGAALIPGSDAVITDPAANVWEPGTSAWDYMQNVAEANGLVVRCDERRRWSLTERSATTEGSVSLTRATELREEVELTDDSWADAVVVRYEWVNTTTGDTLVRYDAASDMPNPIKVVRIDRNVPFPGAGAAAYWLDRMRARGRQFDISATSDYSVRPGMAFTATVPYGDAQSGWVESATWRLPEDEFTIRTRGATDTSSNAIALWPAGLKIDQLVGKIDALIVTGA